LQLTYTDWERSITKDYTEESATSMRWPVPFEIRDGIGVSFLKIKTILLVKKKKKKKKKNNKKKTKTK